jgi:hypothetical protein
MRDHSTRQMTEIKHTASSETANADSYTIILKSLLRKVRTVYDCKDYYVTSH